MAKIFVVGGSGRVASELIKNLINDGNQVLQVHVILRKLLS